MAITPVKMIRLGGESLELAARLVQDFKKKGYRSTYSSVVDTAVPLLHAVTLGDYNLVSDAEVAERRAFDLGGAIATMLAALCSAKVDMSGCQLGYLPEVEAIAIRLDATGDILHAHRRLGPCHDRQRCQGSVARPWVPQGGRDRYCGHGPASRRARPGREVTT